MFFKQVKHQGDNFSYILGDEQTHEAAVIDPSFNANALIPILKKLNLNVKYIIDTHSHGDHVAGNKAIKSAFGAEIVAHKLSHIPKDIEVNDGDLIRLGKLNIKVLYTPGHSPDSICLLVDGKILTGDTLFVGECGRTDLPGGSAKDLYHSLFDKLMQLSDDVEVYPGHDYGVYPYSTIGLERKTNYTLAKRSLAEFVEFMKEP